MAATDRARAMVAPDTVLDMALATEATVEDMVGDTVPGQDTAVRAVDPDTTGIHLPTTIRGIGIPATFTEDLLLRQPILQKFLTVNKATQQVLHKEVLQRGVNRVNEF